MFVTLNVLFPPFSLLNKLTTASDASVTLNLLIHFGISPLTGREGVGLGI